MDLIRRKVRGTFLSTDGGRLRGRVTFDPVVTVYDAQNNVVLMKRPIIANPDASGKVEVDLPITDDPRHTPTGWYYLVTEAFENGPSRRQYWLEVPAGFGAIELSDAITDQIAPKPDYALVPGPQGPGGTADLGSVIVLNPNQNPTVTQAGTPGARILDFGIPRAATVTVGTVTTLDNDQTPDVTDSGSNGDVVLDIDLPQAKTLALGTVTVVNPDQNPDVTDSGNVNGAVYDFDLPRAASVTVGTVTSVNPDVAPNVTDSGTDGDVVLDVDLPRAPTFTVGTVTTVGPADPADVTDVGTNGDIELDFEIPQGVKGDTGAGVEDPIGTDGTLLQADSATSSGTSWTDSPSVAKASFKTTSPPSLDAAGEIAWDDLDQALAYRTDGLVIDIGQENVVLIRNNTGSTLTKGTSVCVAGSSAQRISVVLSDASVGSGGCRTLGLVMADIPNNQFGFVSTFGLLRGVNTNSFDEGDELFISTTPGVLSATPAASPGRRVTVGYVVIKGTQGAIFVTIRRGLWLREVDDVEAPTPSNGQTLAYNDANNRYELKTLTSTDIGEGTNLYFTDTRADDRVRATGVTTVAHGTDNTFARPTAATVYWKGSVAPDNATNGDLWYDSSGD